MRRIVATLSLSLLLMSGGCAAMKNAGGQICQAETKISASITKAANQVGFLGAAPLIGEFLTTGLELFCAVLNEGLSAPANLSDAVGLTTPEVEEEVDEGPEG